MPSVPCNITTPKNLDDAALADWLNQRHKEKHTVVYLHAQYVCKIFDLSDLAGTLHPSDPDKKSKTALSKLAQSGLLQHFELSTDDMKAAFAVDPAWTPTQISPNEIEKLVKDRTLVIGRGDAISTKTAWKVWMDAGGRCMFKGCGQDLTSVPLYNKTAKIGYLAHIIASDPNGPRGTQAESHRLSDDPNNIMLMCDAHHRLIDSFAPDVYTAEKLYSMRQTHRDLIHRYLESLAYPRVQAITLHADLAGIPTHFQESDLSSAILATGHAMLPNVVQHIRRTQRDDRRTPEFWKNYLHEHENHIRQLVSSFNTPGASVTDALAVFPLHHSATMVLAGRIIGEARSVQVFQYHRHRNTWQWETNEKPQPPDTFKVGGLTQRHADEVFLTIELSAGIDEKTIPTIFAEVISGSRMPWVRITTPAPRFDCIRHPDDLLQFKNVARQAINHIQDVMRASRVHLIAISPASTVFSFGQVLQAGHHPIYSIYDRASGDATFGEAFSISGHEVSAGSGSQALKITIR
jgi:hypothetical protein